MYTYMLDKKLGSIKVPDSIHCRDVKCHCAEHSQMCDSLVLDIMSSIIETSQTCIPLSMKSLPGWKENVAPLKSDSLFWHSVWISAGRPASGALY